MIIIREYKYTYIWIVGHIEYMNIEGMDICICKDINI